MHVTQSCSSFFMFPHIFLPSSTCCSHAMAWGQAIAPKQALKLAMSKRPSPAKASTFEVAWVGNTFCHMLPTGWWLTYPYG